MRRYGFILAFLVSSAWDHSAIAGVRASEISFFNDEIEIRGSLLTPDADGCHPGMLMIGGSGASSRDGLMDIGRQFAREGMAVLVYDKRGTGKSSGNWVRSSLYDLAADAAAGFVALAAHPSTNPDRVGFWGISQGGWIVPIAAGRTSAAFAIVVSGGGLTPREVETENYLSSAGRADAGVESGSAVLSLLDAYFGYLAGEQSRESLMREVEQNSTEAWLAATGIENVIPAEVNRPNWAWVATFDPGPSIAAMGAPVLVLLGGSDPLTPVVPTARAWNAALAASRGNSRVILIPGAGHGLRSGSHGGPLVPEFYPLQIAWLKELGVL